MICPELERRWAELVESQKSCRRCAMECTPPLIEPGAQPLFGRFNAWRNGALFIFEAPNWDDTFDPDKGYLTYDRETDPTGRFARQLMVEELGLHPDFFQVTNSVLCLPARNDEKHPVLRRQRSLCASMLRKQILTLDPAVVVPVGAAALTATRQLEKHPYKNMCDAVARPIQWLERWLFPLYHTGRLAINGPTGRKENEQRADWRFLREFLKAQGVAIPSRVI